jgi:hypothetical protein
MLYFTPSMCSAGKPRRPSDRDQAGARVRGQPRSFPGPKSEAGDGVREPVAGADGAGRGRAQDQGRRRARILRNTGNQIDLNCTYVHTVTLLIFLYCFSAAFFLFVVYALFIILE